MKPFLLTLSALCIMGTPEAGAVSILLVDSDAVVYEDSEFGSSAVFTLIFEVDAEDDNLYMVETTRLGQYPLTEPGVSLSFDGIPEDRLAVMSYVSFENVLELGTVNYLAAGAITEMYVTVSVQSTQTGVIRMNVGQIGLNFGGPALPSQPLPIGSLHTVNTNVSTGYVFLPAVPEPSSWILSGIAFGFGVTRRKRA